MLLQAAEKTIDCIIDTVSAVHSLDDYTALLKTNGKLILVGAPESPLQLSATSIIFGKRNLIERMTRIEESNQLYLLEVQTIGAERNMTQGFVLSL